MFGVTEASALASKTKTVSKVTVETALLAVLLDLDKGRNLILRNVGSIESEIEVLMLHTQ